MFRIQMFCSIANLAETREPNLVDRNQVFLARKLSVWCSLLAVLCLLPTVVNGQEPVPGQSESGRTSSGTVEYSFVRDIKPLLTKRCLLCHGPDEESREAGLRLDSFEGATEDLGGYAAIVPGEPEESELITRIYSDDDSDVMPPADHGAPLTDLQKQQLKAWIKSGAKFEKHWSYVTPVKPVPPPVKESDWADWPVNPIDQFTFQRMREHDLRPSPVADRLTLARRLSIDLTGLPPTIERADAFANDPRPEAYEAYVDELLNSDAYGEHWAAMWLDMARYADSTGYAEDRAREIWAYRDYVIRSFDNNQRFDEFTIEQLAGDLIPNPTERSLIATAFHRNTLTNTEGGTDDEEFRSASVVDRTNTTMAVWMGTTMACAQCHTHKYDPITQKEYFQVYAILNNTADSDRADEAPRLPVFDQAAIRQREELQNKIQATEEQLASMKAQPEDQKSKRWERAKAIWESQVVGTPAKAIPGSAVVLRLPGSKRILQLAEVEVFANGQSVSKLGKPSQSSTYTEGPAEQAVNGNTDGEFTATNGSHTNSEDAPWWRLDFKQPQMIDRIEIWHRTDNNLYTRSNGLIVEIIDDQGKVLWTKSFAEANPVKESVRCLPLPTNVAEALAVSSDQRTAQQLDVIHAHFLQWQSKEAMLKREIAALKQSYDSVKPMTTVPVLKELPKPRKTHVQIRGSYQNLGEEVLPGTPEVFHEIALTTAKDREVSASPTQTTRLDLARWLVSKDNPLTARVIVNRYWQRLFGVGLVRTSEDFGAQGDLPTHPQLLDYLAVELMDSGWNNRAVLKQIVMSQTYRQSSKVTPETRNKDASNRWLARGPRFRVAAEVVRDQALFSTGLLSRKKFGPPVFPPAPELNLKAAFSGNIQWVTSQGEDRYRRAIYTQWRRSSPYPSMATFDVSNREVCDLRRISTNTPLQALVTLNDEVYIEAAQSLARLITNLEPGSGQTETQSQEEENLDEARVAAQAEYGFRRVLIRKPKPTELNELVAMYRQAHTHFAANHEDAKRLAQDPLNPVDEDTDWVELASWTTVANVLLNLDEVFAKP